MIKVRGSEVRGTVVAPPSKSHTHRAIFLSGMAMGQSHISTPLISADTVASLQAMNAFGARFYEHDNGITVNGGTLTSAERTVNVGNSGTTLRLLAGLASLFPDTTTIDGDSSLRTRPMAPLLESLTEMGAICNSRNGYPPVSIRGPLSSNSTSIRGDLSSQFISSLLISSGLRKEGAEIRIKGRLSSRPYVDITIDMMERFGVPVKICESGFRVVGGGYRACNYKVPGDFSSAAFPLVAGALCGSVTVNGLNIEDRQGDKEIVRILQAFGAEVKIGNGWVRSQNSPLKSTDVDMSDTPDLFPIVAVLATKASGKSRLYNAQHLRFKETDRIATTVGFLRAMGADVIAHEDGCSIQGGRALKGCTVNTYGDHRIMMAAFVAALSAEGVTEIICNDEYKVSYPLFLEHMKSLGADWSEIR
ncbi:MAG: 3-phosphoshikimate 1-carboxyvinyltransferase [Candidatus Methanomethylophilaceae archaeon]|nr:3-phosphoshikimate 1-carboxyvinyltransferase [Candidatus Methanomethylophilaceae archaeon]